MIKKKAKGKKASKKTAKKAGPKRTTKGKDKQLNPSEVRQNIAAMIEAEAEELAGAVIEEGKKGQLPTVKYLFEVANIHPLALETANSSENEESLAETLLKERNVPTHPVIHELYENGEEVIILPPNAGRSPDIDEKKNDEEALVTP